MISPQFGQGNFVASVPGGIGLPQLVHVTNVSVSVLSVILIPRWWFCNCQPSLYLICFEDESFAQTIFGQF